MISKDKSLSIDGLRGVACIMVIFSHISLMFFPYMHNFTSSEVISHHPIQYFIHHSPFSFFYSGTAAVYIFFVLSGYILTKVATDISASPRKIIIMSIKRYPRLMLPAAFSCIIAYVLFFVFTDEHQELSSWIINYIHNNNNSTFLGALYSGIVGVFITDESSNYNPVLWTMYIELLGSFMIFLMCGLFNRSSMLASTLLSVIFIVLIQLLHGYSPVIALGLISFLIGYYFTVKEFNISLTSGLILGAVGLYFAGIHNDSFSYQYIIDIFGSKSYQLGNFLSGVIIVFVVISSYQLRQIFVGNIMSFLGKLSFSIYLIHLPILATLGVFVFNLVEPLTDDFLVSAWISILISLTIVFSAGYYYYIYIDGFSIRVSTALTNNIFGKK